MSEAKFDTVAGPTAEPRGRHSAVREPGAVLGSYRILDTLGEGGMGIVYLAEHVKLGRKVALKTLRTEYAGNVQAVRRFFAEARAVNRICHEHIVEITDFVQEVDGDNYYIMELLLGRTLADLMEAERVLALPRTLGMMAQVAHALEAVHDAGIIHRDLKPENVYLIERSGQKDFVKLLDFGVAKLLELGDQLSMQRTAAGAILGTPEYMSPEQAGGKGVDHRTDIYAFGVILYELVTGRLPFEAKTFGELVVKHLTVAPTPPRKVKDLPHEVPIELNDLILACLAKDPESRPDSMAEIGARLVALASARGWNLASYSSVPTFDSTGPLKPLSRPKRSPAARRRIIAGVGAAVLVVAAAVTWIAMRPEDTRPAPPAAAAAATPPPPAEKPAKVEIEFVTDPPGAAVYRAGETAPLGVTPLTLSFTHTDDIRSFTLKKEGYQAATSELVLDRSRRVEVPLVAVAPPPPVADTVAQKKSKNRRPAKKPAKKTDVKKNGDPKKVDRTDVMNPFD